MTSDPRLERTISTWLEETAPRRVPDRVLAATFERTRATRQRGGWRRFAGPMWMAHPIPLLGGAALAVVVAVALGLGLSTNEPFIAGPAPTHDARTPFLGMWVSSDPDGSTQSMTVELVGIGAVAIVVHDDLATACSQTPSTMTGTGGLPHPTEIMIRNPVFTCDNGSEPERVDGTPIDQLLRDLSFWRDPGSDTLADTLGGQWSRVGATPPRPQTTPLQAIWPQTTADEVREAQRLADAGDPRYTWQVDPDLAWTDDADDQFFGRFIGEKLGWEEYEAVGWEGFGHEAGRSFIRCAPGGTNPLYPTDERGGTCAPTIDDRQYEQVHIDLARLARADESGIWVVTGWAIIAPFEQVVPPSEAETNAAVQSFVRARLAGTGAEQYAEVPEVWSPSLEVPLLYATTAGSSYERSEFDVLEPWAWPDGGSPRVRIRLFADGGATVVEQRFALRLVDAGRIGLQYDYSPDDDTAPTTENGQVVPVEHRFASGRVRLRAAWPWDRNPDEASQGPNLITLVQRGSQRIVVVADPRSIGFRCQEGEAPANAAALARSIQDDPDLEATAPVATTVGGRPALQMDVEVPSTQSYCEGHPGTLVVTGASVDEFSRTRIWLVDLPGPSPRLVAIAIRADKPDFERVVAEQAVPVLESLKFE